ncbi:hypothetical protein EJV44_15470 [Ancylobacter aquaticus]|nr:hypothetical protein EJV44_15470 [Ancylobacter aquaticus]
MLLIQAGLGHLSERMLEGDLKEEPIVALGGVTPRRLMETLGTDWGRKLIDPGVWVKVTEARLRALLEGGTSVVVDDVRFANEFALIKRLGGSMVHIERPDTVPTAMENRLSAETFDHYLSNDGAQAEFTAKVDRLATRLRGAR